MNEKYLMSLINDYINACVAVSWSGGGPPNDVPKTIQWRKQAKEKLDNYVKKHLR